MRIALTGGRSPLALYFAKKLKELGHDIYMLEHFQPTFATYSSFFKEVKIIAAPTQQWTLFKSGVLNYLQMKKIQLLIPVNEETLYYAKIQKEIKELGVTFYIGEMPLLELLHNKYDFIEWCKTIGLTVPKTEKYQEQEVDFDYQIIKPEYSRFGQSVFLNQEDFKKYRQRTAYIVQEKIKGKQICVCLMVKACKLVSFTAYDTNLGIESYASITYRSFFHPKLEKIGIKLAENLGESGVYSFDFFYDGVNFYPIECNPRLTFGAVLDSDNLVAQFLNESVEQATCEQKQSYGIKLVWFWKRMTQKKWHSTSKEYKEAKDILKESFSIKNWWFMPWVLLHYYLKGKRLGLSITDFVVHDISYGGSRSLKEKNANKANKNL